MRGMARVKQIINIVCNFAVNFLAVIMLTACLPSAGTNGRKTSKKASSIATGNGTATDYSTTTTDSTIYWYSSANYVSGALTINTNISTAIFLRGTPINDYLKSNTNYSKTFCALISYNNSNVTNKQQLRVRAVPVSTTNISTSVQEYVLRLDINDSTTNSGACTGSLTSVIDSVTIIASGSAAYVPSTLCTSCTGKLTSTSVLLYTTTSNAMSDSSAVSSSELSLAGLSLILDISNTSSSSSGSSTDSQCKALGYTCALNGQCVNDGQLRPGATTLASYTQAQRDVAQNASNFILYPEIYYVCGQAPYSTPIPSPAANVAATGAAMLSYSKYQYQCFYDTTTTTNCAIASYTPDYTTTQSTVRVQCGCDADPTASYPDDPVTACPTYGLNAVLIDGTAITARTLTTYELANVARIDCIVPDSGAEPTAFQELQLAVNNRRAPHRMFLSNGTPVSDIADYVGTAVVAEGTPFSYLDANGKTLPDNGSFNMNHITGQFNVSLSEALPAIEVTVEYDQMYTIAGIDGYSTPCLTCARDSWFSAFTAHPESQMGTGVQSISYTTERDNWGDNYSYGNYEDTIFGRACWLPPTMIPWTHNANASIQTQRLNRLQAQAAFWVNGYQKDWWGFNKNALIGSWDGVRWFAIGKGRRVKARTTKLYLAYNSGYTDLAEANDITVQIVADNSLDSAAEYDYDPSLTYNSPSQNSAGSCQMWHMCSTDTDCITRLGWEYVCADVSKFKTLWPDFDSDANEKANTSKTYTIASMLEQGSITGGTNYRCMYKGAGAPCKIKYWSDGSESSGVSASDRDIKLWACAPNFHCEALNASKYNRDVIRERDNLGMILYGKETDVLGRPTNYVKGAYSLPTAVQTSVAANAVAASIVVAEDGGVGLCRPGKDLTKVDQRRAHGTGDPFTSYPRADYISQIAPCDPTPVLTSISGLEASGGTYTSTVQQSVVRTASCPVLDATGNYFYNVRAYGTPGGSYSTSATIKKDYLFYSRAQNACSRESIYSTTGTSAFSAIEAPIISTALISGIFEPTLADYSCLRRAGAVCHTDLDCTPNKLHADQAALKSKTYFGGTEAERNYWNEYLVCGQAASKPLMSDDAYFDYNMSNNRCCREVGKDLTMYTQSGPEILAISSDALLDVDLLSSENPSSSYRYSRYNSMLQAWPYPSPQPTPGSDARTLFNYPVVDSGLNSSPLKALIKQWKTIQETGALTCCGGGFVRKFADGGHDWSKTDRVNFNVSDFQCLNYSNTIALAKPSAIPSTAYTHSLDYLCYDPANGCIQDDLDTTYAYPVGPSDITDTWTSISTHTTDNVIDGISNYAPHGLIPIVSTFNRIYPDKIDSPDNSGDDDSLVTSADRYSTIEFWIPAYINGCNNLKNGVATIGWGIESVQTYDDTGGTTTRYSRWLENPANTSLTSALAANTYSVVCYDDPDPLVPAMDSNMTESDGANSDCLYPAPIAASKGIVFCWDFKTTGKLYVRYAEAAGGGFNVGDYIDFTVQFRVPGFGSTYEDPIGLVTYTTNKSAGLVPGNPMYYLNKFGKFELKGIPQIVYEPIYCNSDRSKLVPDLYQSIAGSSITSRTQYKNDAETVTAQTLDVTTPYYPFVSVVDDESNGNGGASAPYVNYENMIATDDVFAENDFLCCLNLGQTTTDVTNCCSNYGVDDGTGTSKYTCKLPAYADLSVYFNAFVSSDGRGSDAPGGGLTDDDFDPISGEPKMLSFTDSNNNGEYDSVSSYSYTWDKLMALGEAYCESGTVQSGGAFGDFLGEPFPSFGQASDSRRFSIIDSALDYAPATGAEEERGYMKFISGARWNHHIYCAP